LVVSGVATLPAGFRASGIFTAMSGLYFSAVGQPTDYDGDGIVSTRPRETTRNEFRGPSSQNLDLRVEKDFRWGPLELGLFVDVFNATNARNPRLIDANYVEGEPGPRFGEIRVPFPGREVQIGVRARF
jgi:hypothetical protein